MSSLNKFIESPITGGKATLHTENATSTYRKERYSYIRYYYVCEDTGTEFTTTESDALSLSQIYDQYRKAHGIPTVQEIRDLRKEFGISAERLSKILGFGENQYGLYEKGDMPTIANARLISELNTDGFFLRCLDKSDLSVKEKNKIRNQTKNIYSIANVLYNSFVSIIEGGGNSYSSNNGRVSTLNISYKTNLNI